MSSKQRLQKLLAQAGVASRRAAEELIVKGRVRVNGRIVRELGTRADLHGDRVEVDGRRLVAEKPAYYLLHKPREMVTTVSDPEGRESLAKVLEGVPERCFPVGRLDYHTSGALLLTNDGEMADALLHPTQGVPKSYIAKMKGVVAEQGLQALRNGVNLDDGYTTAKAEVFVVREERGNSWLSITIREGKNRQIHRMGDAVGHRVMRLSRSSFAGLSVEGMRPGAMRPLSTKEIDKLKKDYLNPKRRRKANEQRRTSAAMNAEPYDGWGEEVLEEVAAPQPERAPGGPRRKPGQGPPSGARGQGTTHPVAARAVRVLEEKRAAPKSRSIGGGPEARKSVPAKKKGTAGKAPAKPASAQPRTAPPAKKRAAPAKGARRAAPATSRGRGRTEQASADSAPKRGAASGAAPKRGADRGTSRASNASAGAAPRRGADKGAARATKASSGASKRGAGRGATGTARARADAPPKRGAGKSGARTTNASADAAGQRGAKMPAGRKASAKSTGGPSRGGKGASTKSTAAKSVRKARPKRSR